MAAVQRVAKAGVTVCATIHSPTPFAFALFDRLMMLLRGRVIYFGHNGELLWCWRVGEMGRWAALLGCSLAVVGGTLLSGPPPTPPQTVLRPGA